MPVDDTPILPSPAAPPERRTALRVILLLSALAHVALLAFFSRSPPEPPPPVRTAETVRVLRGEVTVVGEPGLRLLGYAEVPAPARTER